MSSRNAPPPPASPTATRDQPLDRALQLLGAVLDAQAPVSISTIAEHTGLPLPSAHRLAGQLEDRGLLRRAFGSRRLLPGPRLLSLGLDILRGGALRDAAQAILAAVAEEIGEHCQIGVVVGHEVAYVASARAPRPGMLQFEPGLRAPIHCTSTGKLFLSSLPEERLEKLLQMLPRRRYTANTLVEAGALRAELNEVRARGWASSNQEFVEGVVGCAVPILRKSRDTIGSLAVSVPAARVDHARLREFIPPLRSAAEALAGLLEDELHPPLQ